MRAYLVVPIAGLDVMRLNNNSDNSNPRCLPIRTTFFNNNNTYRRFNDLCRPCTNNRPIRRPVANDEGLRECHENEDDKTTFVQTTWLLVVKHAAATDAVIKK